MEVDDVDENNRLVERRNTNHNKRTLCVLLTTMSVEEIAKTLKIASHINSNVNAAIRAFTLGKF